LLPTEGNSQFGGCGGSLERWFLYFACHHEFMIVEHRVGDEKLLHLMEDVVVEGALGGMRQCGCSISMSLSD